MFFGPYAGFSIGLTYVCLVVFLARYFVHASYFLVCNVYGAYIVYGRNAVRINLSLSLLVGSC